MLLHEFEAVVREVFPDVRDFDVRMAKDWEFTWEWELVVRGPLYEHLDRLRTAGDERAAYRLFAARLRKGKSEARQRALERFERELKASS